jgi:hypothetical protein
MKRKTYKKAHKEIKEILKRYPKYDDFEIKFWGSRMFVRDPRGYSFPFIFHELPCFGFGFMKSKEGTKDYPDGSGKYSWGGYIIYLKPDDYKTGRGRKPWILGDWCKGAPN